MGMEKAARETLQAHGAEKAKGHPPNCPHYRMVGGVLCPPSVLTAGRGGVPCVPPVSSLQGCDGQEAVRASLLLRPAASGRSPQSVSLVHQNDQYRSTRCLCCTGSQPSSKPATVLTSCEGSQALFPGRGSRKGIGSRLASESFCQLHIKR